MASPIPSDIASYLTPEEKVVIVENAEKEVYVTNKRVILKKKGIFGEKKIVDASFRHISSIEYEKEISLRDIAAGIGLITLGLLVYYFRPMITQGWYWEGDVLSNVLYIISIGLGIGGVILIAMGVLLSLGPPVFTLHIVGREPIELRGRRFEVLFKAVRQYREDTKASDEGAPRFGSVRDAIAQTLMAETIHRS
jgi:hypothetical protein